MTRKRRRAALSAIIIAAVIGWTGAGVATATNKWDILSDTNKWDLIAETNKWD